MKAPRTGGPQGRQRRLNVTPPQWSQEVDINVTGDNTVSEYPQMSSMHHSVVMGGLNGGLVTRVQLSSVDKIGDSLIWTVADLTIR